MTTFIIDNGCNTTKFGLSNQKSPTLIESIVGFERGIKSSEMKTSDIYVGLDAIKKLRKDPNKVVSARYPFQRGLIVDWTQTEAMWDFCFSSVKVSPKDYPLLMTMHSHSTQFQRESSCELVFELFNSPKFYCEIPGFLSYWDKFGNEDGIIIESGSGVTDIIPVIKGQPHRKQIVNFSFAGQDISNYLSKLILLKGYNIDPKEEWKIISHVKENLSFASYDFDTELKHCKKDASEYRQELEVKTGEKISLDSECFRCTEILFDPSIIGVNNPGLHESVFNMLNNYPEVQNLVLSGGNMKIHGISERMEKELKLLAKQNNKKLKLKKPVVQDDYSSWKGATKYSMEKINWITKKDYDENGSSVIFKNCF